MNKFLLSFIITLGASNSFAECKVAGDMSHWVADYCMALSETDDYFNDNVRHCVVTEEAWYPDNSCASKIDLKKRWCTLVKGVSKDFNSVDECLNNNALLPNSVKNNGVQL